MSLVHAFKRQRAISQMGQQSSCKWYKSVFNSLFVSVNPDTGTVGTGIRKFQCQAQSSP